MGKTVLVESLPASASEAEIRELFSDIGAVESVRFLPAPDESGACTVEMASDEEAETAVSILGESGALRVRLAG